MDENTQPQQPLQQPSQPAAPQAPQAQAAKPEKKGDEEFSIAWHAKVLFVIYVILFGFYLILKFTLK